VFQCVRGTHDLLPEECHRHLYITDLARRVSAVYGFEEIATPIFEFSGVFQRLGETTDIITKETYSFQDRGGEDLTLRPEGTAPIARAVISNGLTQKLPLKFFYAGPMFRYDRPQKGRQRQFHQIGIELIGVAEPLADIECISLAAQFLDELGLLKRTKLHINTLGDYESREKYKTILVSYLEKYKNDLSEDSQNRLYRNPLRILDSKDKKDREIIASAPLYSGSLTDSSKDFFAKVLKGLDLVNIPYELDPHLVRGLDYYCHTAFVFVTTELGAQSEILGGGRYDGLIKSMGGPETPGIGWAAGIERLSLLADIPSEQRDIVSLIPLGERAEEKALALAQLLRKNFFEVDLSASGSLGKRLKRADKIQAKLALIFGDDEIQANIVQIRTLSSGEQTAVASEKIHDYVKNFFNRT
jgi:histidyl-tRNA synthetase